MFEGDYASASSAFKPDNCYIVAVWTSFFGTPAFIISYPCGYVTSNYWGTSLNAGPKRDWIGTVRMGPNSKVSLSATNYLWT